MTKHTARTASTTKKYLAAGGLALAVAGIGLLASAGTAAADGHNVQNPDGTFGATDGASPSQRLGYDQPYGVDWVPATFSYDTSSYPAGGSYPAETVNNVNHSQMAGSSLPASSWPDRGWGVDEHG
jgi:hypothetical protein